MYVSYKNSIVLPIIIIYGGMNPTISKGGGVVVNSGSSPTKPK